MRPTIQRELLLYSQEREFLSLLSLLTSLLSLIVYLSVPFSLHLTEKSWQHLLRKLYFFSLCACVLKMCVYDDGLCHDIKQSWVFSQLLFTTRRIPLWINRNIRWVQGRSWRGEVFSFRQTVLNWREPSGKRQGPQSLEQVPFVKNRMWKKHRTKSARVFKHYGIFWSSFGVCEFLLRWLLNAVFPLF